MRLKESIQYIQQLLGTIGMEVSEQDITNVIIYADRKEYVNSLYKWEGNVDQFTIYETRLEEWMEVDAKTKQKVEQVRKRRSVQSKRISSLNNLIQQIDKSTKNEENKRIKHAFEKYRQVKQIEEKMKQIQLK